MNMIRNGPTIRLSSTPGRRSTSRSSLPVNDPIRMRLSTTLRMDRRPSLAAVLAQGASLRSPLLHEPGEDLVEGRLVLLDAFHLDAVRPKGIDDRRRQRSGIPNRGDELARGGLPHVQHSSD